MADVAWLQLNVRRFLFILHFCSHKKRVAIFISYLDNRYIHKIVLFFSIDFGFLFPLLEEHKT
ncbi:hypothetical protein wTpre_171 [Wolbachia endosymbiont of Trichogramma pretiosum]|nr:hypothetical protein wTpre_171 [Wolbachia endosymbiont of Trichogramma pretiosum]